MNILIVAATALEIKPLVSLLESNDKSGGHLRKFSYKAHSVDILVTGIGIPFTIYNLTSTLHDKEYDLIINAGIAGSFSGQYQIGDVVQVITEQFADIGIEEKDGFTTIFKMNLHNKDQYPFENGILKNSLNLEKYYITDIPKANGITVNKVSGNKETIDFLRFTYKPGIETMEGAAFFYVCLMEQQKFLQIRSISNFVEERDISKWDIPKAVDALSQTCIALLEKIQ
ncbi:MAG: futalosine hydrolase [Bacteroidetes bacterium RIFOXYA12_FULL_35_11]|nr:MAG: futalosine hydrolase [Bacteroidetes bacterium GWF2_35_48]OFY76753.1 MAG: futalosine hydrolase [Bacteroidetes bacterium RIFOXYA12_FULL_35_11]OFY92643.1 MAG: futalosine hydrolase [Bacteroidetes bacterium RIFOXYC12_FULL_35_7]HBX50018.1 futalosine hydrolase [Bacteroidales bacterium]